MKQIDLIYAICMQFERECRGFTTRFESHLIGLSKGASFYKYYIIGSLFSFSQAVIVAENIFPQKEKKYIQIMDTR